MPSIIGVKDASNTSVNVATVDTLGRLGYELVAESQSNQVLGSTGANNDIISHVLIRPANTTPGAVTLYDNGIAITLFPGGAVSNLLPIYVPLHMMSSNGAWKMTTGSNVSVIAIGLFT